MAPYGAEKKELGQKCDRISQKYLILANVPFTKIEQIIISPNSQFFDT